MWPGMTITAFLVDPQLVKRRAAGPSRRSIFSDFRRTPTARAEGVDRIGKVASEKRVSGETRL